MIENQIVFLLVFLLFSINYEFPIGKNVRRRGFVDFDIENKTLDKVTLSNFRM